MEEAEKKDLNRETDFSTMPFTSVVEDTVGLPPGSPIYIGDSLAEKSVFSLYQFSEENLQIKVADDFKTISSLIDKTRINWINVNGISPEIIESICVFFSINPLTTEDILNTKHRPKVDSYEDYLFLIIKMLKEQNAEIQSEQVSLILKKNVLITIQEDFGDCFEPVRLRIQTKNGRLRKKGADYLAYTLLDVIVDNYFVLLERVGAKIETVDREIDQASKNNIQKTMLFLQDLKSDMSFLRRIIWPTRELVGRLSKLEEEHFAPALTPFLRDLYENILQTMEAVDTYKEQIINLIEYSLSTVNNRMSEVMKMLTIISTIFIPLTFIAGLYGMNFKYMPELEMSFSYPLVLGIMALIAIGELIYFKIKKWL